MSSTEPVGRGCRLLLAAVVMFAAALGLDVSQARAGGACAPNYDYASQWTATTRIVDHDGACANSIYSGWAGVNSSITTPTNILVDYDAGDNQSAWIMMFFVVNNQRAWLQVGNLNGVAGHITGGPSSCTPTLQSQHLCVVSPRAGYIMYLEYVNESTNEYYILNLGSLSLGQATTYRIERTATSGCWNVYISYNHLVKQQCGLGPSGMAEVSNEIFSRYGSAMMVRSDFGYASGGTNSTLRILSARGYQDWNTSLLAGSTGQSDEQSLGGTSVLYVSQAYYYIWTWGLGG